MLAINTIEDGIPLPPTCGAVNSKVRAMRPGQSFFLANKKREEICGWRAYWGKKGIRFDVRKEKNGIRVWCRSNDIVNSPATP